MQWNSSSSWHVTLRSPKNKLYHDILEDWSLKLSKSFCWTLNDVIQLATKIKKEQLEINNSLFPRYRDEPPIGRVPCWRCQHPPKWAPPNHLRRTRASSATLAVPTLLPPTSQVFQARFYVPVVLFHSCRPIPFLWENGTRTSLELWNPLT